VNKAVLRNILILLLLAITVFSVFKYVSVLNEKDELSNTLNQVKKQITALEKEKQNLLETLKKEKEIQQKLAERNSELKENLKAGKIRLTKLFRDVREKQRSIEQLNSKPPILKTENTALDDKNKALADKVDKLKAKLRQVSQENESLKAKLSSIAELKKALRELKIQVRKVSKVSTEIKPKTQEYKKIVEGNRGFLLKDGKLTYPARVRIEVIPAIK